MFNHLQITNRKERFLVGIADAGLRAVTSLGSTFRGQQKSASSPQRILLLRLERIGDLLMTLDAIALVRRLAPHAHIDLVVGSWNFELARLIPGIDLIETLDLPWMARGAETKSWTAVIRQARGWRIRDYDLAINFEPDIRSNLLMALSGATRRVGFGSGGGSGVLSVTVEPDSAAHTATNAITLVARAFEKAPKSSTAALEKAQGFSTARKLNIPDAARRWAAQLLERRMPSGHPLIGIQPAAGRQVKEWDPIRFAETGVALARARGAKVMLIGSAGDAAAIEAVKAAWPSDVPVSELPADTDLVGLAAVLARLDLFITGDTGPMHLAAAVGTPIVAIFGPSLPSRYAPLSARSKIVRIDLPCSPCNRMRQPPERCVGIIPDCLSGIQTEQVLQAANELLDQRFGNQRSG